VTVNAVALGIVVEQRLATAGFDAVGFLTAELQDIFGDIVDLRRVKEFVGASRVCSGLKSGNQAATWATSASPPESGHRRGCSRTIQVGAGRFGSLRLA